MTICGKCNWDGPVDDSFWEIHQTLANGDWWCTKPSSTNVDDMTKAIVNRYKAQVKSTFGNKKRHRQ